MATPPPPTMPVNRGSVWQKWDLHIHTPVSFHWEGRKLTDTNHDEIFEDVALSIERAEPAVFAIMDYWTFEGYIELRKYLKRFPEKTSKCILPGVELRLEAATDFRLNTHVILSDALSDEKLRLFIAKLVLQGTKLPPTSESLIQIGRDLPPDAADKKGGYTAEDRSSDKRMLELGLKIAVVTRQSFDEAIDVVGRENCLVYQPYDTSDGMSKLDWEEHVLEDIGLMRRADIFEVKGASTIELMLNRKPGTQIQTNFLETMGGYAKPVSRGSDAHKTGRYGDYPGGRVTWMKAQPSFDGLKQVCCEPSARCHIGEKPPKLKHVEENPTKYIASIRVENVEGAAGDDQWFGGVDLPLNPGLIAIVGNKGSGKTALADVIALAGNSRTEQYEFLTKNRFRKVKGVAERFRAVITWCDGTESERLLSES